MSEDMPQEVWSFDKVAEYLGLTRAAFGRLNSAGGFFEPNFLHDGMGYWLVTDVKKWKRKRDES